MAPESDTPSTPPPAPESSAEYLLPRTPATPPPTAGTRLEPSAPEQRDAIHWDLAWKGALICGIGAAALTAIPVVSLGCCLWMLGAGALTVWFYQRKVPGKLITPGMGMRMGALSGAFAFVVNAIATTAAFVGLRSSGEFNRAMQQQMQKQMSANPDPKVQEMMHRVLDWVSTPQGAGSMMVLVLVGLAIMFVLFTAAGGALGASLFGKRRDFR